MKTITDTITLALPAVAFPMAPERILFFDIETTGLSPRASSLYLIGTILGAVATCIFPIFDRYHTRFRCRPIYDHTMVRRHICQ